MLIRHFKSLGIAKFNFKRHGLRLKADYNLKTDELIFPFINDLMPLNMYNFEF